METTKQATKRDEKTSLSSAPAPVLERSKGDPLGIHEYDFESYSDADAFLRSIQHIVPGGLEGGLDKTCNTLYIAITASEKIAIDREYSKPDAVPTFYPSTCIVHYVSLGRFCQLGCTSLDGALKTVKALASDGVKGLIEVL